MGIFSNSVINLLSSVKSKFPSLSHNNKLKLLAGHIHEGDLCFSLLSTNKNFSRDDSDIVNYFNFPWLGHYFFPDASCGSLLFARIGYKLRTALWNPTTDEVKTLPDCESRFRGTFRSCYGFGLDPSSQDYKVIRFVAFLRGDEYMNGNRKSFQVELYSLKTDSWKDITSSYPHSYAPMAQPSIHINGFYYWVDTPGFILSFDFANEKFSSPPHIPLPETDRVRSSPGPPNVHLAEFHGSLAALVYTDHDLTETEKPFEFEIWVWNDESWTRVHANGIPAAAAVKKPLGLFGNDQLYLLGSKGEIVLFDCATRVLKNLGLNVPTYHTGTHVFPYVESSFPLNGKKIIRANHKMIKYND